MVGNAVCALQEIRDATGLDLFRIDSSTLLKLVAMINDPECPEWTQVLLCCCLLLCMYDGWMYFHISVILFCVCASSSSSSSRLCCVALFFSFLSFIHLHLHPSIHIHISYLLTHAHTYTYTHIQVYILDSLARFHLSTVDIEKLALKIIPRLSHSNAAVVMSAVRILSQWLDRYETQTVIDTVLQKLPPPLVCMYVCLLFLFCCVYIRRT